MSTTNTLNPEKIAIFPSQKTGKRVAAAYEHPWVIRFTHWVNAFSLLVLIGSGIQIFFAFPSFGPKIPQNNLFHIPPKFTATSVGGWFHGFSLGGWLAGGWQWHFTFIWIFIATGILYLAYQIISGHYKTVLFTPKDIPGVWPMVRHYFLFGKKPPVAEQYNPLQKLAYTSTVFFGVVSVWSGLVIYNPAQFSWLGWPIGGFHYARIIHFAAMCGFLAFIPGHIIMVILHGWHNFLAMLTGWKKNPEYLDTQ